LFAMRDPGLQSAQKAPIESSMSETRPPRLSPGLVFSPPRFLSISPWN
jgi:hypothetical protein